MKIEFEKVQWKNLLSYGDEIQTYEFKNGIDLINAKNGAGKSTIIESVFYTLFGVPFRKIKKGSLINDINKKKLLVELYFNIDKKRYKIKRGQKPNIFVIYEEIEIEDGKKEFSEIPEKATVKEYQDNFESDILKIDETVFRQLISISSNIASSKPFMELTQKEKEKLFQVVTDTSIFNHLSDKIRNKIQDAKIEQKETDYKLDMIESSIQSEQVMIDQAKKQNDDFQKHHKDNIQQTEENIRNSEENIQKYENGIEKLKELKVKFDEENIELQEFQQELTSINFDTEQYTDRKMKECIERFDDEMKETDSLYYTKEYKEYETITQYNEDIVSIIAKIRDINIIIKQIEAAKKGSIQCKSCETVNYITDVNEDEIQRHDEFIQEIKDLEQSKLDIKKSIDSLTKSLNKLKEQDKEAHDLRKSELKKERDKCTTDIKENNYEYKKEEREELKKQISEKTSIINSYKEKLVKSKHIKTTLQEHESNLEFYSNKLVELSSIKMVDIDEDSLKDKKSTQKEIKKLASSITKSTADLNYLLNMISDKGENNLKGQVISRTVPFLNKGINYFLEKFSQNSFNFVVDEQFKEKIISRENNTEYNSLSNGQKMRISFSIMFGFLKLIEEKNGVSTNILYLDEVMDGSLDAAGREELLHILKDEFSEQKNIVIISHNDQIKEKTELFDRIVTVEKNKFSSLNIEDL